MLCIIIIIIIGLCVHLFYIQEIKNCTAVLHELVWAVNISKTNFCNTSNLADPKTAYFLFGLNFKILPSV